MATKRLDAMMFQCVRDIEEIASSEADISNASNRLLAVLSSNGLNRMTSATQQLYKKNTETLLDTLIAYTSSTSSKSQATSLSTTLPGITGHKQLDNHKTNNVTPASVVDLQNQVHYKCRQIRQNGMVANIINETVQLELGLNN